MTNTSQTYFAALPQEEIAGELNKRVESFFRYIEANGLLRRWKKAYGSYYGVNGGKSSSEVVSGGEQGELSLLVSNEYRNLINHLLVLTCQAKPAMQCRAANSDYDSDVQCILGNGLLEYYLDESNLERYLRQATEISLVLDAGFLVATWDPTLGEDVAADLTNKTTVRTGDIKYGAFTPLDIIYDYTRKSAEDHQWYIVKEWVNKFDLAAQFPEMAEDILSKGRDVAKEFQYRFDSFYDIEGIESSEIPRYTFYHKKSPALPGGRIVQFLDGNTVLFEGPIPYRKLPVVRISPGEMIAKSFGYSPGNDLLALQDVVDMLISAGTTNLANFAVTNVWLQPDHNLEVSQLAGGGNIWESKVEPKPINMANFPPTIMNFMNFIIERMQTLSGVNATARGNPPSADMSGSALALLQSMALQFNSGLAQSYAQLISDSGQLTINHLQDFGDNPRIAIIAGKFNQFQSKTFTKKDLDQIQRVHVDLGNALSKTASGRIQMAQDYLKQGWIKSPEQYEMVVATGRLEPLIEDEQAFLLALRQENEALASGESVSVIDIENHPKHIQSHYALIATPDAKKDPKLVQNTLNHIQQHMTSWHSADPALLQVLGIQPPPPPPMQPGMPPQQNGPSAMPMPQGPQQTPPRPMQPGPPMPAMNATPPVQLAAQKIHEPNLPRNALSKNPWNPQTGGL